MEVRGPEQKFKIGYNIMSVGPFTGRYYNSISVFSTEFHSPPSSPKNDNEYSSTLVFVVFLFY